VVVSPPADLVLLLPGWGTPAGRMEPLSDALSRAGAVARVWSYTPEGALDELVDAFVTAADAHRTLHAADDRLHLVGHSLGGVVAAAAALRRRGEIASVTTINTPWRGTWVSYTGTGPLARSLRWGSPLLADLREDLAADLAADAGPRWLLLAAAGDLATPATTSLAGGPPTHRLSRRVVAATGHSVSLTSDRLITSVVDHVLEDREPPTGAVAGDATGRSQ
jgi:pimeloyl-ACP methyl ester carboxylesterase